VFLNLKLQGFGRLSKTLKIPFINDNHSLTTTLLKIFDDLTMNKPKLVIHQVSVGLNNLRTETGQLEFQLDAS
jgi:hypothetical protein